jgi:hypothetical protein
LGNCEKTPYRKSRQYDIEVEDDEISVWSLNFKNYSLVLEL